jgi:hypothetical protein
MLPKLARGNGYDVAVVEAWRDALLVGHSLVDPVPQRMG